jgi:hypothetical protein
MGIGGVAAALAFAAAFFASRQNPGDANGTADGAKAAPSAVALSPTEATTATVTATTAITASVTATPTATPTATAMEALTAAPTATETPTAAPTATEAPTAAPTGTDTKAAAPVSADAAALRAELRDAANGKAWRKGAEALISICEADPEALKERDVAAAAVTIAANLELGANDIAEQVFEALGLKGGAGGADVLYEIASTRGGSKAAGRANELLRRKEVLEKASPALRIALDIREAACKDKLSLLDRAKAEGDLRAVGALDILRSDTCNPRVGQCCYRRHAAVEETIHLIRARLRGAPSP